MAFKIHQNFCSRVYLSDLPLCKVLLENEKHYPWLLLVPKRANIGKIMDLCWEDQLELLKELDFVQKILFKKFSPSQINVAAIGNKTPQLHIHVIARFTDDPAWPNTVWDHPIKEAYSAEELKIMQTTLQKYLNN